MGDKQALVRGGRLLAPCCALLRKEGAILIVGDSDHGPYREIPIRVELLRVKDKGFIL
jgi:hypothetical protein